MRGVLLILLLSGCAASMQPPPCSQPRPDCPRAMDRNWDVEPIKGRAP